MKIYIPHLHYTVYVREFKKSHPDVSASKAYTERLDKDSCVVFIRKKEGPVIVAHELIHVLQFICNERGLHFVQEQEHMAYLMSYLMGRILGYHYV